MPESKYSIGGIKNGISILFFLLLITSAAPMSVSAKAKAKAKAPTKVTVTSVKRVSNTKTTVKWKKLKKDIQTI